ncbi:ABC transporter ATP-binding protein/permease [Malaciobacter molluscorum]|uniref:ABC transporter ATP-binding protein n=1 Tax=Malaciobacter molluscorum TaxID=1032072 RepID=UPI00100B9273|nr:ABC transporter ATP-binding protein [Malaciobacter molluscorum]RXJ94841.1 ABC transporter ATP-binding protein/permease [Malaciobacter molluscorum]
MNASKKSSLIESYKMTMSIADKYAILLKKSFFYYIVAYIFQGLVFVLFFPFLSNIFLEKPNFINALVYLTIIIVFSLISFIFRWFASNFEYSKELIDISYNLRIKLGQKIKSMPLQNLYKYRTGELNSILSQNVDESVLHMGVVAGMFFEVTIVPIVIMIATFFINPFMALALIIALPLAIPIYRWSRTQTKWDKTQGVKAHAVLEADTIEYIQGLPILKALNQVGDNAKTLQDSINKLNIIQKKGVYGSTFPMIVMNTLIEFTFLLVLSLGSIWISRGELNAGELLALLIILNRLSEPLSLFLGLTSMFDLMEASFKNIKEILNIKDFKIHKPASYPQNFNINFKNVSFCYENNNKKTLNNLFLDIKQNSLTAIVGPSGSGKTTITKLIMRYADPQIGTIKIGGVDIKNIEHIKLMSYISVVFQDVYLFDDTILNNIKMGKPNASKEEILAASKASFCHEFISRLPNNYNTKVGEIGASLSGGERQRISIARAILKNSPIVILDEPTSALDTQSEIAVQKALDKLIKNKTVIVIAHKLSTISHADNIIVIENGKLKEKGNHQKLMGERGKYYSMVKAQQRVKEWNVKSEIK